MSKYQIDLSQAQFKKDDWRLQETPQRKPSSTTYHNQSPLNYSPYGSKATAIQILAQKRPIHQYKRLVSSSPGRVAQNNIAGLSSGAYPTSSSIHNQQPTINNQSSSQFRAGSQTSVIYKDFDVLSKMNANLASQACNAGQRALATTAIYKDSPHKKMYRRGSVRNISNNYRDNSSSSLNRADKSLPQQNFNLKFNNQSCSSKELFPELKNLTPKELQPSVPTTSNDLLNRMFRQKQPLGGIISPLDQSPLRSSYTNRNNFQQDDVAALRTTHNTQIFLDDFVDNMSTERARNIPYPQFTDFDVEQLEHSLDILPQNDTATFSHKVQFYSQELFQNPRKEHRLGSLVAVHLLIMHNQALVKPQLASYILQSTFSALLHFETQQELFIILALEVIQLLTPYSQSHTAQIPILRTLLFQNSYPRIQRSAINAIITMGYDGIAELVELASKEYNTMQAFILQSLAQTPHIQKLVIVPSLFNTLCTSRKPVEKQTALAALNRMYDTSLLSGGLQILINMLEQGTVDRQLVASVIRATGALGQEALLDIIKQGSQIGNIKIYKNGGGPIYSNNNKVKIACASVLQWRVPINPPYLKIQMDNNQVIQLSQAQNIGTLFTYHGEITPLAFYDFTDQQIIEKRQEEYLEINTRDFLASLRRMLALNADHSQVKIFNVPQKSVVSRISSANLKSEIRNDEHFFLHHQKIPNENFLDGEQEEIELESISQAVIKVLCGALKDRDASIRETSAGALGTISIPQSIDALDNLVASTQDSDSNVRAMSLWAIGRLGSQAAAKGAKAVVKGLKDSYWKVRTAACIAAGCLGPKTAQQALPNLIRLIKEGAVNRQTVAQTVINLGALGEQALVELLKNEPQTNAKLWTCIVRSLALANVSQPTIDFAIQALFKAAKDRNPQVRKDALISLDVLHRNAMDSVTYLRPRHLLPFFYQYLNDGDKIVRQAALKCIQNFGPQGELIFIQGLTKDKNPNIRAQCSYGLGSIGPSTFRTLLLGLHDSDPLVREATGKSLVKKINPDNLIQHFRDKPHQRKAINCTIKEVLNLPYTFPQDLCTYLQIVGDRVIKEGNPPAKNSFYDSPIKIELSKQKSLQQQVMKIKFFKTRSGSKILKRSNFQWDKQNNSKFYDDSAAATPHKFSPSQDIKHEFGLTPTRDPFKK